MRVSVITENINLKSKIIPRSNTFKKKKRLKRIRRTVKLARPKL